MGELFEFQDFNQAIRLLGHQIQDYVWTPKGQTRGGQTCCMAPCWHSNDHFPNGLQRIKIWQISYQNKKFETKYSLFFP